MPRLRPADGCGAEGTLSGRYIPPDHPRAIFAGDAERDMERLRAQQQPAQQRPRFAPPQRRDAPSAQQPDAELEPDTAALRARAVAMGSTSAPASSSREGPDPGEIIADIARPDGTVLRVAVKHYHAPNAKPDDPGAPYVDLRVWQSGEPGAWPVKGKGLSVKPRELARVAEAILDAADKLSADRRGAR